MNKFKLSAFADEYSDDINEQIKVLVDNKFDMIELRFVNGKNISDLSCSEANELQKKLVDNNIKVSSIGSPLGKINLADNFLEHLDKTKRTCETAIILKTKNVRVFSFYLPKGKTRLDCRNQVIDYLGKMLEISKEYGLTFCHENEANIYGESPKECKDLLTSLYGLKCVFDMGNFVLDGYNPLVAYRELIDYIEYFHIKDALYEGAIVPAGKGEAQIKNILDDYKYKTNSNIIITLEPHLQTFSGLNALVGKKFDNPYKYANQKEAFIDAIKNLRSIL